MEPGAEPACDEASGTGCEPPAHLACGWAPYDDGLSGAQILQVLFDTRVEGRAYAVTPSVVYRSDDAGESWQLQGKLAEGAFATISPDGDDPDALLAATSVGVARSQDAGETWTPVALAGLSLGLVVSEPARPLRVYATGYGTGVLRSNDGGVHWSGSGSGYPYAFTTGLSIDPENPEILVTSAALLNAQGGFSSGAILRSIDGGATWTSVLTATEWIARLQRCQADRSVIYATVDGQLARSSDGGASWTLKAVEGRKAFLADVALAATDCDDLYLMEAYAGPRHSATGGDSYGATLTDGLELSPIGSYPGNMAVDPRDASHVLLASQGGVYSTRDHGQRWRIAPGLHELSINSLSSSPADPERVWLSTWGQGVWTRASPNERWERIPTAALPRDHNIGVFADPMDAARVFVSAGPLFMSSDEGGRFDMLEVVGGNPMSVAVDPRSRDLIYVATQIDGVYKSSDGGAHWALSNGELTPWDTAAGTFVDVRRIVVDPREAGVVYAGTNGRGVYKSGDGGATWNHVFGAAQNITCLEFGPGDEPPLYACAQGVQRSDDGGTTWTDISEGLPTLDIAGFVVDDETGDLYASTQSGVFLKHGDEAWAGVDTHCLPSAANLAIAGQPGSRFLVTAADGTLHAYTLDPALLK